MERRIKDHCRNLKIDIEKKMEEKINLSNNDTKIFIKDIIEKNNKITTEKVEAVIEILRSGPSGYKTILKDIVDILSEKKLYENDTSIRVDDNFSLKQNANYSFGSPSINVVNDNEALLDRYISFNDIWSQRHSNERKHDNCYDSNNFNEFFVKGIAPSFSAEDLAKVISDIFNIEINNCIDLTPKRLQKKHIKYKCFKISINNHSQNLLIDKKWQILNAKVEYWCSNRVNNKISVNDNFKSKNITNNNFKDYKFKNSHTKSNRPSSLHANNRGYVNTQISNKSNDINKNINLKKKL
jgi:hypothetical protein